MAYFKLIDGSDSQFYFTLRADNNEALLQSEGYRTKQGRDNGISSVRANAPYDRSYKRFGNPSNCYFRMEASQGEPIGKSENYNSQQKMEHAISVIKREAPTAPIKS